jgi:iron complex outermembrane receptor protein
MRFRIHPLATALAVAFFFSSGARQMACAQSPEVLEEIVIRAARPQTVPESTTLDPNRMASLRAASSDAASLLRDIPGVSIYGAGGVSGLPSIHGLADDRLRIKVDGMDMIASCPNHMNPPLSYLDASGIARLQVFAGISPVSVGGDSIGGTIFAETRQPVFAGAGEGLLTRGEAGLFYRSNGGAFGGNVAVSFATQNLNLSYTGASARAANYDAGDDFRTSTISGRSGHRVDLDEVGSTAYKTRTHTLGFAIKGGDHLLEAKLGYQEVPYQLYPNQRMDMLDNEQKRFNLRYLGRFAWGGLEARAYHERVEHRMDFGADKRYWYGTGSGGPTAPDGSPCSPIGMACAAGMPMLTSSRNTGATVKADVDLNERNLLRVGAEYQHYTLDDWWPASGAMMWPNTFVNINDGERDRKAVFAEWEARPSPFWMTLAGVRFERVETDSGPVNAYSNSTAPVPMLQPQFNARNRQRSDNNWDATLLARHTPNATFGLEFGLARKVRSPSLYERYTWFSRGMEMLMINWVGDGNGYIGDIDLDPEKAHTVSATFDWHADDRRWELKLTPYYTHVADYIDAVRCPTRLGGACTAANQTATGRFVYLQLANQSARLYGLDLSGHMPLVSTGIGEFGLTGLVGYTNGRNRDTGDDLYNIMPLNAKLALTHKLGGWDNAIEVIAVKAKDDVSDVRNEIKTSGYGLVNLRASYGWKQMRVDFGVENLFDRLYYLPLGGAYNGQGTTMTTGGASSPAWGVAVPGMGRSGYVSVNVKF